MRNDRGWVWCLAALVCAAGCAGPVERPPRRELPRLDELQTGDAPTPPDELKRGPAARLRITRLDFAGDAPLDEARALLDQHGAAPPIAPLWRDNGMVVRIVGKDALDDILAALPPPTWAHRTFMTASDIPTPLDYRLTIRRRQRCVVTLADGVTQTLALKAGRCRFLVEATPRDDGSAQVSVTPQHHEPRVTIAPRSVLEKQLDGRVFRELSLAAGLTGDTFLMLLPTAAPPASAPGTQPETAEGAPQAPDFEPPKPAGDLGRLLLRASRDNQHVKMLVIIGLEARDDGS